MELDCTIVSVEYKLGPEFTYADSLEDNYAALAWVRDNASALGIDPERIVLVGESAGGRHAALLALLARDLGEISIAYQVLMYPMLDDRTVLLQPPPGVGTLLWPPQFNRAGWKAFLGQEPGTDTVPSHAVSARAVSLENLPPTWIGVGSIDLFFLEDKLFAERLVKSGVPTEFVTIEGAYHGFDVVDPSSAPARRFEKSMLDALRKA